MDFNEYMMSLIGDQGEQKRQAELLRGKTNSQLSEAVGQSKRYNTIAAVAPMLSNPGLAKSAEVLAKQGEDEAPKITNQQIYYGGEGRLEENPIYTEAKASEREGRVQNIFAQQLAANERAGEANALRYTLGTMADQTKRDLAAQSNALRYTLAEMARDRDNEKKEAKAKKDAEGKTLSPTAIEKFSAKQSTALTYGDLLSEFKPDYAGTPGLAGLQNKAGQYIGLGYEDQANWWSRYNEQSNTVRKELFGSAVTAPEKAMYEAATIAPGMEPGEIKRRLGQQAHAIAKAANKLKADFGKGGYNVSQFDDLPVPEYIPTAPKGTGARPVGGGGKPAAAPTADKKRLKLNPQTGELE